MTTSLSRFWVTKNNYDFGPKEEVIGRGGFGLVVKARDKKTGEFVAVKFLTKPLATHDDQRYFARELEILANNSHPTTLRLLGFGFAPDSRPMVVTEVMSHGTLADALKKECEGRPIPGWDATRKSIILFGIPAGMAHLHSHQIIHRDLKPDNVFLNDRLEPVIADFGISRQAVPGVQKTVMIGTPQFMAPDLVGDDDYGCAADLYSFAVLLYSFFAKPMTLDDKKDQWKGWPNLWMRISAGARFVRPPNVPDLQWELIERAWATDPSARPTFLEMIDDFHRSHAYLFPGSDVAQVVEYENRIMAPMSAESEAERQAKEILRRSRRISAEDALVGLASPRLNATLGRAPPVLDAEGTNNKEGFVWD
jgi:serine/threonine protein kinase